MMGIILTCANKINFTMLVGIFGSSRKKIKMGYLCHMNASSLYQNVIFYIHELKGVSPKAHNDVFLSICQTVYICNFYITSDVCKPKRSMKYMGNSLTSLYSQVSG